MHPGFEKKNLFQIIHRGKPDCADSINSLACFSEALELHSSVRLFPELRFQTLVRSSNRVSIDERTVKTGQPTSEEKSDPKDHST